jgi:uncharacterized iron-regulated membrane protein
MLCIPAYREPFELISVLFLSSGVTTEGLLVIMAFIGALFPLVGASLLIAFGIDRVLEKLAS